MDRPDDTGFLADDERSLHPSGGDLVGKADVGGIRRGVEGGFHQARCVLDGSPSIE